MGKRIDEVGNVYGRLTVVSETGQDDYGNYQWNCLCSCGQTTEVKGGSLRKGDTKSCGCLQRDISRDQLKTHGMSNTQTYERWVAMRQRCINPTNESYPNYGGRGISVCDDWVDSFETFYSDMGAKPEGRSLDRVDNNGDYNKDNCRWATKTEQDNNKRTNKLLTYDERTQTLAQWCSELNLSSTAVAYRLRNGWSTKDALTIPIRKWNRVGDRRNEMQAQGTA